ncbi:hypothetical protein ATY41_07745 [Leifsonia xyli subsp. xyli]|uniref:CBM6 domain-containing protein n=1 Tax=Leifsonia xyli subsp. xyli TaxID=59736 RepID=A0A1E2SM90_LEIXY|nr:glycoside hydrolase family 97 catalytic domain-containing protein [Leifsonia xyli]ODA90945.1 hypothetical protein ATY41_07745 [Leifsonia xyli subsp. xyli]
MYENAQKRSAVPDLAGRRMAMPLLASAAGGSQWMLLTEAAVYAGGSYPAVRLDGGANGVLRVQLPGPDRSVFDTSAGAVRVPVAAGAQTPWRVIELGSSLAELAEGSILADLNDAPSGTLAPEAASWIRPGTALWPWWTNSSPDYIALHQQYIDAAERLGVPYVVADLGYSSWADIATIGVYARMHGVGVIAWLHKNEFRNPDGSFFDQATLTTAVKEHAVPGVVGLKVDFFDSDRAETMAFYPRLARAAASSKLVLSLHGATKPGGEDRTYPNIFTSEAIGGDEWYKMRAPKSAADNVNAAVTRGLLGSAYYTPDALAIGGAPNVSQAHQLALTTVIPSALTTLADSPNSYEGWAGWGYLADAPTVWDQSLLLDAVPDSHVAVARRSGETWRVAAIDDAARTVDVPLGFLGEGAYTATSYTDGADGTSVAVSRRTVTADDRLSLNVALHGGAAVVLTPGVAVSVEPSADRVLEAETATLSGAARIDPCVTCSGGFKVGYLGVGGRMTFSGVEAEGDYRLRVAYLLGEPRSLTVTVDGVPVRVTSPVSGAASGVPIGWDVLRSIDTRSRSVLVSTRSFSVILGTLLTLTASPCSALIRPRIRLRRGRSQLPCPSAPRVRA